MGRRNRPRKAHATIGRRFAIAAALLLALLAPAAKADSRAEVTVLADRVELTLTLPVAAALALATGWPEPAFQTLGAADRDAALGAAWPAISGALDLRAGAQPLEARLQSVNAGQLSLEAALPEGRAPVRIGIAHGLGPLTVSVAGRGDETVLPGALSAPVPRPTPARNGAAMTAARFVGLGFSYVLPGVPVQILFAVMLLLGAPRGRDILRTLSALGLGALAGVGVLAATGTGPDAPWNALLLSGTIVWAGAETMRDAPRTVALATIGGAICMIVIAGPLLWIGLAPVALAAALPGFALGALLGWAAVMVMGWALAGHWFGDRDWWTTRIARPAGAATVGVSVALLQPVLAG